MRFEVETKILKILERTEIPVTCSYVRHEISRKREVHFDTVKKYLDEMTQRSVIFKKTLPPTKKQHAKGMTLYSKKLFPHQW